MDSIDKAFKAIGRSNFVLPGYQAAAFADVPLPIGYGQTISQPTTVRMMLEWLDPKPGQKILDVGSGSGWATALLAYLVGLTGHIYAVEKIPELVEFGRENCKRQGIKNASFAQAGETYGLTKYAPYDRILVSASGTSIPNELQEQLKEGGKLIIPVRNDILELTKISKNKWDAKLHPGFVFVPLV